MLDRADFIRESIDYLHRFMMKVIQNYAEEHGFTVPQIRVTTEVLLNKKMTIKQLTHNLRMTQSTVSDIVERLTARGILVKTPNPKDKRSVEISLSDKTIKGIKEKNPEPLNESVREVLNRLTPNEQEIVEEGMRLLVSAVKEKMEADGMNSPESFDILFFPKDSQEKQ